jgi:hypothetical protein
MTNDQLTPKSQSEVATGATDDEVFLAAFEAGTWPFEKWHHREHIRVAYLYLCRHSYEAALEKMRSGIKALNIAHKVPERPDRGYHETMTQGWMRVTHHALTMSGKCDSSEAFLQRHNTLLSKDALLRHYTKDRLMSQQARKEFVEPDLVPLP